MIKDNKKIINAWAFYDWANSVYPLVITAAIFPIFYENITQSVLGGRNVNLFGINFINTELYDYTIALSFLLVAAFSPLLSGIADYTGNKKKFLKFFCYLGSAAAASLFFFDPNHIFWGLLSILFASLGFWSSLVFYNAYLPEIASVEKQDKVSAKGFSLGYLGSALLLIFSLILIQKFESFGFESKGQATRTVFVLVGVWWTAFAQITYRRLPNNVHQRKREKNWLFKGYQELKSVALQLKGNKQIRRYLYSFFAYSMGVQTVMLVAVLFAKNEIENLPDESLIISVLLIQFIGIIGASGFAFLSKKLGNLKALMIAILFWVIICCSTYLWVFTATHFYFVAAAVGLVMGGIQALSRSTYAKMLPKTKDHASFFSFYDVTEKVAIVIGMFSFGFIEGITGSMRNSILALIVFFILGFILLLWVPKTNKITR